MQELESIVYGLSLKRDNKLLNMLIKIRNFFVIL